jgi:hypothetical protein
MWRVPSDIFIGLGPVIPGLIPSVAATPIDQPVNRVPVAIAAGGQLVIALPIVPVGGQQAITALGIVSSDYAAIRTSTRINGIAVAPLMLSIGAQGTLQEPTPFGSPLLCVGGDVFDVLLENISGLAITATARIVGWIQ